MNQPDNLVAQINQLLQQQNFAAALPLLQQLTSSQPQNAEAWRLLGLVSGQAGDNALALEALQKATSLAPQDAQARVMLCNALVEDGQAQAALQQLDALGDAAAAQPQVLFVRANALFKAEQFEAAVTAYEALLKLQPGQATVTHNLAVALMMAGRLQEALAAADQSLALQPDYALAMVTRADILARSGDITGAILAARAATQADPELFQAWSDLGRYYLEPGYMREAEAAFEQALALRPDDVQALYRLGYAQVLLGKMETGWETYSQVLQQQPDHEGAISGQANILQKRGDMQAAYDMMRPLVTEHCDNAALLNNFAAISVKFGDGDLACKALENFLSAPGIRPGDRKTALFALAKLLDRQGDYDAAFASLKQANDAKLVHWDAPAREAEFDEMISLLSAATLKDLPHSASDDGRMIFIVGMPRSGTSLVEQILASHPDVYGAGELNDLTDLVSGLPQRLGLPLSSAQAALQLTAEHVEAVAAEYRQTIKALDQSHARVTDKMPGNFMNVWLMQLAFPDARVIWCRRHPLDNCLSIYFQDFTGTHEYAYDLAAMGHLYRQSDRLMQHWSEATTLPLLEVAYESVVDDLEGQARRLLDFCGLGWDPACLDFYKTRRDVITSSVNQVREPVYRSSVAKYRHYEKHLGPLKAALGL